MNRNLFRFAVMMLAAIVIHGCAFSRLQEEIETMQTNVAIGGELKTSSPQQLPLTVIIYSEIEGKKQISDVQIVNPADKFYFFIMDPGDYYAAAFEDANANFSYDEGEYFGLFGKPDRIHAVAQKPIDNLDIEIARTQGFPSDYPTDISKNPVTEDKMSVALGRIASLDDDIFSDENAKLGFWQPVSFIKKVGAGTWFLKPYDPAKIPILFVHGAAGSPRNFQTIAEHIDRSRYQPWFFYYPSGIPLEKVSRFLNDMITELHRKFQFKQLYVTAHSMGGLVARGFILRNIYDDGNDYIKLFVSISSPFGGLETAQKGVEKAPVAIPSWYDVVPGSAFIESIFSQPLAPKIDYYLLFSFKGDCSMFMDNNDGAVTLRSQLDPRAQRDAVRKWGFDKGHVEILSSPELLEEYSAILKETAEGRKGTLNLFGLTN